MQDHVKKKCYDYATITITRSLPLNHRLVPTVQYGEQSNASLETEMGFVSAETWLLL